MTLQKSILQCLYGMARNKLVHKIFFGVRGDGDRRGKKKMRNNSKVELCAKKKKSKLVFSLFRHNSIFSEIDDIPIIML